MREGYACARVLIGPPGVERILPEQPMGFACSRPRQGFCYRYPYRCSRLKVEAFRADRARRRTRHGLTAPASPHP
jgi:hypothetical protein